MRESIEQGQTSSSILDFEAVLQQPLDLIVPFKVSHDWYLQEEEDMTQTLAYASEDVGDIMYYHEAIIQPDAIKFAKAIIQEVNRHVDKGNWELVPRSTVPEGVTPVLSI